MGGIRPHPVVVDLDARVRLTVELIDGVLGRLGG